MLLAIMIVPTLRAYLQQRAEYAALTDTVAQQHQSLDQLQGDITRWNDPAYVEQQARERLKFVRPGETAYQVIGAEKLLGDNLAGRSRVVVPHAGDDSIPWYGKMWTSIEISDRPDVDEAVPLTPVGERPSFGGDARRDSSTSSDPTAESSPDGATPASTPDAGAATGPATAPATGAGSADATAGATGTR